MRPKLAVFASGGPQKGEGGSGFEKLVLASREGILNADIVLVVSNHMNGGVRKRAQELQIPFFFFHGDCQTGEWEGSMYQRIARDTKADFFALSGWLKLVRGLDPNTRFNSQTVFNIHPGPLPEFGGKGMHGHHVHEEVIRAYRAHLLKYSAVSMHFVTDEYDRGPVFFRRSIKIHKDDTALSLGKRVNTVEHNWQAKITNLVVSGKISWNGSHAGSLTIPPDYEIEQVELDPANF